LFENDTFGRMNTFPVPPFKIGTKIMAMIRVRMKRRRRMAEYDDHDFETINSLTDGPFRS
jgi:hypothetical protein